MNIIKADPGEMVSATADRALRMAHATLEANMFEHNGVVVRVYPHSDIRDLCEKWDLTRRLMCYEDDGR